MLICVNLLLLSDISSQKEPKATEVWIPEARVVTPAKNNTPPSDAIVLFDGKNLEEWSSMGDAKAEWEIADNCMTVLKGKGNIKTKRDFGDGRARYEEIQGDEDHHHHLIDVRTGKVIEFYNEELERLKVKIANDLGYELVDHHLELFGSPIKKN